MKSTPFQKFRIIFGLYNLWHFASLIPYGAELFSNQGIFTDPHLHPLYRFFPNPLIWIGTPIGITFWLLILCLASCGLIMNWHRRVCAGFLWFGATSLFHQNPLTLNPSVPYLGLLSLLLVVIPHESEWKENRLPREAWWVAWILLMAGYTFSGVFKMQSPSWQDGSALLHVAQNPLARDYFLREWFLQMPVGMIHGLTWFALIGEIIALPLALFPRIRWIPWVWMVMMHLGILSLVSFADLTVGMLMMHAFTAIPWAEDFNRRHPD